MTGDIMRGEVRRDEWVGKKGWEDKMSWHDLVKN